MTAFCAAPQSSAIAKAVKAIPVGEEPARLAQIGHNGGHGWPWRIHLQAGDLQRVRVVAGFVGGQRHLQALRVLRELQLRSEERRVGKERRSRWSPYH